METDVPLILREKGNSLLPDHLPNEILEQCLAISSTLLKIRHDFLELVRLCEGRDHSGKALPTVHAAKDTIDALKATLESVQDEIESFRQVGELLPRISESQLVVERSMLFFEQVQALQSMLRRSHRVLHGLEQRHKLTESSELFALSSGVSVKDSRKQYRDRAASAGKEAAREVTAETAKDLTNALFAAEKMLQAELEKSREIAIAVESSTGMMKSIGSEYRVLSNVIQQSRRLVTHLAKRNWTDRVLLFLCFGLFLMATLYVFRRRFVVPGGWLIVEFFLFFFSATKWAFSLLMTFLSATANGSGSSVLAVHSTPTVSALSTAVAQITESAVVWHQSEETPSFEIRSAKPTPSFTEASSTELMPVETAIATRSLYSASESSTFFPSPVLSTEIFESTPLSDGIPSQLAITPGVIANEHLHQAKVHHHTTPNLSVTEAPLPRTAALQKPSAEADFGEL